MSGVLGVSTMLFTDCITGNWLATCILRRMQLSGSDNRLVLGSKRWWEILARDWMRFNVSTLLRLFKVKTLISLRRLDTLRISGG